MPDSSLSNPILDMVAKDVLSALKYRTAITLSDAAISVPPDSLEAELRHTIELLSNEQKALLSTATAAMLITPDARQENFGRHALIEPAVFIGTAITDLAPLDSSIFPHYTPTHSRIDNLIGPRLASPSDNVVLEMSRIKCIQKTDYLGNDDILLSVIGTAPQGQTAHMRAFKVGGDDYFTDNGKVWTARPVKTLLHFKRLGSSFPWEFTATFLMAEEDMGGFYKAAKDTFATVTKLVQKALSAGLTAAFSSLGIPGTISKMLSEGVSWLVGKFITWLTDLWDDDPFTPKVITKALTTADMRFPQIAGGRYQTDWFDVRLKEAGGGGVYEVRCRWGQFNDALPSIDAVVGWPDSSDWRGSSRLYFFGNDQYSRYELSTDTVRPGYPYIARKYWSGLPVNFEEGIDAAMLWPNGKMYVFSGDMYARYDVKNDQFDSGYPSLISSAWSGFPATFQAGIDAAVVRPDGKKAYIFRGSEYIRYDIASGTVDDHYPRPISGNWSGFPAQFSSGVDAALYLPSNGKYYFFKDDWYIRFDARNDSVDSGYPLKIRDYWPGVLQ